MCLDFQKFELMVRLKMKKNIVSIITASVLVLILTACATNGKVSDGFVFVEGGTFQMGDDDDEYASPKHLVEVNNFYICDHEVTQKEYLDVRGENPSNFKGDYKPVECVSWYDAVEYCNALSVKKRLTPCYTIDKEKRDPNNKDEGDGLKWTVTCNFSANGYRLPTEAEWEYAVRGGKKSKEYEYSGSNNIEDVAWYEENSNGETHDVKTKSPNELGLYDMSGNIIEMCWDWYAPYVSSFQTNPTGALFSSYRIIRDFSWKHPDGSVSARFGTGLTDRGNTVGFRVVCSAQ